MPSSSLDAGRPNRSTAGIPSSLRFVRLLDRVVDREVIDPRHLLDRLALVDPVRDEHRIDEVGGAEMGLADETAQRVRGA